MLEIWSRQEAAGFLYCNYTNRLMYGESSANFLALYNLPPKTIEQLKARMIGVGAEKQRAELAWLLRLPKSELHCHLGGIADIGELIEIAAANRDVLVRYQKALSSWLDAWRQRLDSDKDHQIDFKQLRKAVPGVPEPLCVAAFVLLFEEDPDQLDKRVFGPYGDEEAFCGIGFDAYEALGDLQGSGLLQSGVP